MGNYFLIELITTKKSHVKKRMGRDRRIRRSLYERLKLLTSRSRNSQNEVASNAVKKCRDAINILENQDISLQTQMRLAEEEARALLRIGDKGFAETALKKKELMMRESERIHQTKVSLLSQILLVETAETRATALEALSSGLRAHKFMSAKMFGDAHLERLQEELMEQACFEAEVSNVMSQSFEAVTCFDDETNATLEKALEELQHEEVTAAIENASLCSLQLDQDAKEEAILINDCIKSPVRIIDEHIQQKLRPPLTLSNSQKNNLQENYSMDEISSSERLEITPGRSNALEDSYGAWGKLISVDGIHAGLKDHGNTL